MAQFHLTFDIDWAPDWMVHQLLDFLQENNCPATFFVTHASDSISRMKKENHHLGLHPNFAEGSTQGNTATACMNTLLDLVPDANCLRSHGLFQSTGLFQFLSQSFPQIEYDLSLFTHKHPCVALTPWGFSEHKLKRINYNWEDDAAFFDKNFDWQSFPTWSELIVFDFHPVHFFLNSNSPAPYQKLKQSLGQKSLMELTQKQAKGLCNTSSAGAKDFLTSIVKSNHQPLNFKELVCALDS